MPAPTPIGRPRLLDSSSVSSEFCCCPLHGGGCRHARILRRYFAAGKSSSNH
jgi:hypothetical protein